MRCRAGCWRSTLNISPAWARTGAAWLRRAGIDTVAAAEGVAGGLGERARAEESWRLIAVCEGCGREARVEPGEVLSGSSRAHGGMALDDVAGLLRCRGCGCGRRMPRLEPVVPVRKQAFVGGPV